MKPFIRGMRGYASVLRAIHDKPLAVRGLMEELKINRKTAQDVLLQFHAAGLAHVSGTTTEYRSLSYLWSAGPGVDAEAITAESPKPKIEMVTFQRALKLLNEPMRRSELCEALGVYWHCGRLFLNHMHDIGMVYIDHWVKQPDGPPVAAYRLGWDRKDATRPKPKPPCEVWRSYDQRRRAKQREARPFDALAANFFSMKEAA